MTVSNQDLPPDQYDGNDLTTEFPITFDFADSDHIVVTSVDSDNVETVGTKDGAEDYDYAIAGTTVTMNAAPATGITLVIDCETPLTQAADLMRNRSAGAEVYEAALDKLTLLIRDRAAQLARSLVLAATADSAIDTTLPLPSAGGVLGWSNSEDSLENVFGLTGYTISTFAETLLDDNNAAKMLATLGISNLTEADAVITDNALIRGDGGARKVQKCSTITISDDGEMVNTGQPCFSVKPSSDQENIALGGVTTVLDTEIFDIGNNFSSNTFTAPVDGKYQLNLFLRMTQIDTAATYILVNIITSNRTYGIAIHPLFTGDLNYMPLTLSIVADMDANDTAYVQYHQAGGDAQTDINNSSYFSGVLIC